MKKNIVRITVLFILGTLLSTSCKSDRDKVTQDFGFVSFSKQSDNFPIVQKGRGTLIYIDDEAYSGVKKITSLFQADIKMVTNVTCDIVVGEKPANKAIIIGTIGKSSLLDELVQNRKLNIDDIKGKWETSLIQVVENPFPNVDKALVIAGSDKRGTIYGMLDISKKMGVSPWYWWADVPVQKHKNVFIKPGRYNLGEPKVKYRGIFLNDEEPALGRWVVENYGGFNHEFYAKVFELLLRQKANFLWPAMWWAAFNTDDPLNPKLADEMGIVMSTSHHEPMMCAHAEWKKYGGGEWNYISNKVQLDNFWREGIKRMGNYESVVTLAMRGDGDEAMEEGTNIQLLEQIVSEQRKIIEDVRGKKANEIPQVWALYKEVQAYYDNGMKVPDDVTLLFCDDNWGNVRDLPNPEAPKRVGGYGMYYHFDYVGAPRCYRWLNVNSLPRVWEQLRLTYEHGVDRIWLVNVGDLKPMELPISFFCDYAWNPDAITVNELNNYTTNWATEQFGEEYAKEIAELLDSYSLFSRRRTPELLNEKTFSLNNYREFEIVVNNYNVLAKKAAYIYDNIDRVQKDAFYQLVYFPIEISANLYNMYWNLAKNKQYANEKRSSTNEIANKVIEFFERDAMLTKKYHTQLSGGKWNHMMAQSHIGYTSWNSPNENIMPDLTYISVPTNGNLYVKVEGINKPLESGKTRPLHFDGLNNQKYYIEVFNTGNSPIAYEIVAPDWIKTDKGQKELHKEVKYQVSIDWEKVSESQLGHIKVKTIDKTIEIQVSAKKYDYNKMTLKSFIENNGVVSIEAVNFTSKDTSNGFDWEIIPGLSNTLGGITSVPVSKGYTDFNKTNTSLEYTFSLLDHPDDDLIKLHTYFAPTLDYRNAGGLRFAMAVDDNEPIVLNLHEGFRGEDWNYASWWTNAVASNKLTKISKHKIAKSGTHTIKYWLIDPGLVLQKLIIDNGGLKPSYLGPVESKRFAEK